MLQIEPTGAKHSLHLTQREHDALALAARGYSDKLIAFELGVKESTAKTWIRRGRLKLGGAGRSALPSMLARLRDASVADAPRPASIEAERLTPAERGVLSLLLTGWTDAAIASARGRSARTIANQSAAIYRKLGVRCRRELWALALTRELA